MSANPIYTNLSELQNGKQDLAFSAPVWSRNYELYTTAVWSANLETGVTRAHFPDRVEVRSGTEGDVSGMLHALISGVHTRERDFRLDFARKVSASFFFNVPNTTIVAGQVAYMGVGKSGSPPAFGPPTQAGIYARYRGTAVYSSTLVDLLLHDGTSLTEHLDVATLGDCRDIHSFNFLSTGTGDVVVRFDNQSPQTFIGGPTGLSVNFPRITTELYNPSTSATTWMHTQISLKAWD